MWYGEEVAARSRQMQREVDTRKQQHTTRVLYFAMAKMQIRDMFYTRK